MSGVESSSVPEEQVTGNTELGTDTLNWWNSGAGVPEAPTDRLAVFLRSCGTLT